MKQSEYTDELTGCTVRVTWNSQVISSLTITKLFTTWSYAPGSDVAKLFGDGFTKGFQDGEFSDLINKALASPERRVVRTTNDESDHLADTCCVM